MHGLKNLGFWLIIMLTSLCLGVNIFVCFRVSGFIGLANKFIWDLVRNMCLVKWLV